MSGSEQNSRSFSRLLQRSLPRIIISIVVIITPVVLWILLSPPALPLFEQENEPSANIQSTQDVAPPYVADYSPVPMASGVVPDTQIVMHIKDDGAGVDRSSIEMLVNGKIIAPFITGDTNDFKLVYKPSQKFGYGQAVHVIVQAADLAPAPNVMKQFTYSFTIDDKIALVNGKLKLSLVYYGKHEPEVDSRIIKALPEYVIANPPHGLWGEAYGYNTWWLLQNISLYQKAGIKVIGYITGGYEGKGSGGGIEPQWYSLELNKKLIKNMAEIDHVDGVMIDECSAFPNEGSKKYLKELTDLAHSYSLITWGNVGQDEFDPWYFTEGRFDLMKSTEKWQGQSINKVQEEWGSRISVTGFDSEYTAGDAYRLTIDAWEKGIAYCYISNTGYSSLPTWFEEYVQSLRNGG